MRLVSPGDPSSLFAVEAVLGAIKYSNLPKGETSPFWETLHSISFGTLVGVLLYYGNQSFLVSLSLLTAMRSLSGLAVALFTVVASVRAQGGQTCNTTSLCPSSAPCCSEYGYCGTDTFCLGGCNPLGSHSLDSCRPNPVCKDAKYTWPDVKVLANSTYFDGNASRYDFIVEKGNVMNGTNGELVMLLTEDNGGTKLSSTRYVHYGKITTRSKFAVIGCSAQAYPYEQCKPGSGVRCQSLSFGLHVLINISGGVVATSILMSSIKDEIDWVSTVFCIVFLDDPKSMLVRNSRETRLHRVRPISSGKA